MEPLLSLKLGRLGGARGEAGTEQKEVFAEDGDEKVLMPSVNEMLWGSKSRKEKWEHNFTHYHQKVKWALSGTATHLYHNPNFYREGNRSDSL